MAKQAKGILTLIGLIISISAIAYHLHTSSYAPNVSVQGLRLGTSKTQFLETVERFHLEYTVDGVYRMPTGAFLQVDFSKDDAIERLVGFGGASLGAGSVNIST